MFFNIVAGVSCVALEASAAAAVASKSSQLASLLMCRDKAPQSSLGNIPKSVAFQICGFLGSNTISTELADLLNHVTNSTEVTICPDPVDWTKIQKMADESWDLRLISWKQYDFFGVWKYFSENFDVLSFFEPNRKDWPSWLAKPRPWFLSSDHPLSKYYKDWIIQVLVHYYDPADKSKVIATFEIQKNFAQMTEAELKDFDLPHKNWLWCPRQVRVEPTEDRPTGNAKDQALFRLVSHTHKYKEPVKLAKALIAAGAKPVWGYVNLDRSVDEPGCWPFEQRLWEPGETYFTTNYMHFKKIPRGAIMPILHAAVSGMDDKIVFPTLSDEAKEKIIRHRKELAELLLDTFNTEELNLSTEATVPIQYILMTTLRESVFQTAKRIGAMDIFDKLLRPVTDF